MRLQINPYVGFSNPYERIVPGTLNAMAEAYGGRYLRLFVEKYSKTLKAKTSGVIPLLESVLAKECTFEHVWDPSFADLRHTVLSNDEGSSQPLVRRSAQFVLHLMLSGYAGTWEARALGGLRLRLHGWVLPPAEAIHVSADRRGLELTITSKSGSVRTRVFRRSVRGTRGQSQVSLTPRDRRQIGSLSLRMAKHRALILTRTVTETLSSDLDHLLPPRQGRQQLAAAGQRSLRLLKEQAPYFHTWVDLVIRGLIPCRSQRNFIRSGSDFNLPGLVQISFPATPIAMAEMLVHEASHQYFQILGWAGDFVDGTDRKLYYSPVKNMNRPLDKILLAYHAFANVLLFYRECIAVDSTNENYLQTNALNLIPQLKLLERPLKESRSLTPLGRALWEPLSSRVQLDNAWAA